MVSSEVMVYSVCVCVCVCVHFCTIYAVYAVGYLLPEVGVCKLEISDKTPGLF